MPLRGRKSSACWVTKPDLRISLPVLTLSYGSSRCLPSAVENTNQCRRERRSTSSLMLLLMAMTICSIMVWSPNRIALNRQRRFVFSPLDGQQRTPFPGSTSVIIRQLAPRPGLVDPFNTYERPSGKDDMPSRLSPDFGTGRMGSMGPSPWHAMCNTYRTPQNQGRYDIVCVPVRMWSRCNYLPLRVQVSAATMS